MSDAVSLGDSVPPAPGAGGDRESVAGHRIVALIEVVLCSDFVTQIAAGGALAAIGLRPFVKGTTIYNINYIVALSLGDAALLIALMLALTYAHNERPRDVFLGSRPVAGEALLGAPLAVVALCIAATALLTVRRFAPWLHTVPDNPLQEMLRTPRDAWLFALVLVVAGGVREEMQRAFLMRRFDRWLGGGLTGVIVTSVGFGAGHFVQGVDAAIATGLLGAFWAAIYLRRRSCIAPMVSHSAFDLLQIVPFLFRR